jgi:hypothetical protein
VGGSFLLQIAHFHDDDMTFASSSAPNLFIPLPFDDVAILGF